MARGPKNPETALRPENVETKASETNTESMLAEQQSTKLDTSQSEEQSSTPLPQPITETTQGDPSRSYQLTRPVEDPNRYKLTHALPTQDEILEGILIKQAEEQERQDQIARERAIVELERMEKVEEREQAKKKLYSKDNNPLSKDVKKSGWDLG